MVQLCCMLLTTEGSQERMKALFSPEEVYEKKIIVIIVRNKPIKFK